MDKDLRDVIVSTVFSLVYITFGIVVSAVALTNAFRHAVAIRNNVVVEGTVQDMTFEFVHAARGASKKVCTITFLYKYEGQECTGKFRTDVPKLDFFRRSEFMERRYSAGTKMPVLITPDWSLIVYSERKKVLADDVFNMLFCFVMLAVALSMLYRQLDAIWERKCPSGRT